MLIANQLVTDVLKLHADLIFQSRIQLYFDQRIFQKSFFNFVRQSRWRCPLFFGINNNIAKAILNKLSGDAQERPHPVQQYRGP